MSERVPCEHPVLPFSGLAFVGEAPAAREVIEGRPLVGPSGKTFNAILEEAEIDRRECFVTNVADVRAPNDKFELFDKSLVPGFRERLWEELAEVSPKVVVALGSHALRALTRDECKTLGGPLGYRGSPLFVTADMWDQQHFWLLPTFHPAYLNKCEGGILPNWSNWPLVRSDVWKAKRFLLLDALPPVSYETEPLDEDCEAFYVRALDSGAPLAFDIETAGHAIKCVGFSLAPYEGISIPVEHRVWIERLLDSPNPKVAQNAMFDVSLLRENGLETRNLWFDTMIAHHVLNPELPHDLYTITSTYADMPQWKQMRAQDNLLAEYNCRDVDATQRILGPLLVDLERFGFEKLFFQTQMRLLAPLMEMGARGLRFHAERRVRALDTLESDRKVGEARLREMASATLTRTRERVPGDVDSQRVLARIDKDGLNAYSPSQVRLYLEAKHRKTLRSTDEKQLKKLAARGCEESALVLRLRHERKFASTYLSPFADRFCTSYKIHGTATSRLSSGRDLFGRGGALQQFPHALRDCIIPDEGNVFVAGDLSQAEARIVACLAGDQGMLQVFSEGRDIHRYSAALLFDIPEESVTPEQRAFGKAMTHALNYDVGPNRLMEEINAKTEMFISFAEARRYIADDVRRRPAIARWKQRVRRALGREGENGSVLVGGTSPEYRTRAMRTFFGFQRAFHTRWGNDLFREAYNFEPQATVGGIVNEALLELCERLPKGASVVLQLHDSLLCECRVEQAELVSSLLRETMERAIVVGGHKLVIPCEVKSGYSWAEV